MKNSLIVLVITLIYFTPILAQEDSDIKLTKAEKREEIRKQKFDYINWERKYFNSPGKWFLYFKGGYSFPFLTIRNEVPPPFDFIGKSVRVEQANGAISDRATFGTEGGGARIAIAVGKMFNPFFGFEMEIGYMDHGSNSKGSITTPTYRTSFRADLWEMYTAPKFIVRSPTMNNFYIYGKIGPHVGFWGRPTVASRVVDQDGSFLHQFLGLVDPDIGTLLEFAIDEDGLGLSSLLQGLGYQTVFRADAKLYLQEDFRQYEINGVKRSHRIRDILKGLGINASVGVRYQATPIVSVFAEAEISGFNVNVAQSIINDFDADITILNGAITLAHFDENGGFVDLSFLGQGKQDFNVNSLKGLLDIIYFNQLDENSNNPSLNPDSFNPFGQREELAPRLSVSRVGFNIGVQVNIPDKDVYYRENSKKNKNRVIKD